MKAVLCKEWGMPGTLVVEDVPSPKPGSGQVVVSVKACGVNFPDTLIIQGKYQFKPEMPFSPGGEVAGVIKEVGEGVTRVRPGDRVIAFNTWGGFAEEMLVDADRTIQMPASMDFVPASAFVLTYGTSYHALKDRADIKAGETMLVLGAAGGVGLAAIQLGKAMGALVRSVESGGPADKAGIEAGDIITKFDGKSIDKSGDLPRIVGGVKPGTRVGVQVFRRGGYRDFSVTVAEVEPERTTRTAERETRPKANVDTLGLVVADLTDAQKRELKIKNGVRVESTDGVAARAGLREGDVILSVDNAEVTSAKQFEGVVAKLDKARAVTVLVKRGDAANFIVIKPSR